VEKMFAKGKKEETVNSNAAHGPSLQSRRRSNPVARSERTFSRAGSDWIFE
jgi:hypothetical protein